MAQCKTQRDFLHELFTVCQHLTRQLVIMHRRKLVLRDICLRNVVRTNLGQVRSWTFLEYAGAVRSGTRTDSMAVRTTPPAVRPWACCRSCSCSLVSTLLPPKHQSRVQKHRVRPRGADRCVLLWHRL